MAPRLREGVEDYTGASGGVKEKMQKWISKEKRETDKDAEGSRRRKYRKKEDEMDERKDSKRERLGIRTWNVRSLNDTGRLEEVTREMKRYGLNVLGVSEVRQKGQDDIVIEDVGVRMTYSGGEEKQRGVGILFDEETTKRIVEVEKCSDR